MGSKIEWTEETWNPIAGCSDVSPGCRNCYAKQMAARLEAMGIPKYQGLTKRVNGRAQWTGQVNEDGQALLVPLERNKATMYFANSMSDLFHERLPDEAIDSVFAVMALCGQHTFQVLTKRAARLPEYLNAPGRQDRIYEQMEAIAERRGIADFLFDVWPLPNVWLGVSVEDQQREGRIAFLQQAPAAVRFLSCEPLLGPLDLRPWLRRRLSVEEMNRLHDQTGGMERYQLARKRAEGENSIDWVIVGGESGLGARPMHPDWVRAIRDLCTSAGVPFFFKQWGEWFPAEQERYAPSSASPSANSAKQWLRDPASGSPAFYRVGKKAAGRLLDGREWNEFPEVGHAA